MRVCEGDMSFYAVLGVPPDADEQAIRQAYRRLARRYHPDRGQGSSIDNFRRVNEAYETLSDSARRHAYDLRLNLARPSKEIWSTRRATPRGRRYQEDPRVFGS